MLNRLLETSSTLKKGSELPLPIHAPYHAPELFEQVDFPKVVLGHRLSTLETLSRYRPYLPLLSTSTGEWYTIETTLELLTQIIQEVLKETLRWDLVLARCVSEVAASESHHTTVLTFGPTKAAGSLMSALQANNNNQVSLQDSSSWISSTRPPGFESSCSFRNSKLAIVGLAGRFPGGGNHEKFWEVLEKGLDVHKEVMQRLVYYACRRG